MAAGYNGQVIMVLPDLDVVAVTTARDSHNFGEFAGFISRSVKSDTALPADTAGAKLLADKIRPRSQLARRWRVLSQERCTGFRLTK